MEEVTYDEMLEMASLGAKVLHGRCVEIAKKYGVELLVCSSLNRNSGTMVREKTKMEKMLISGVAADKMWQKSVLQALATIRRARSAS